MVYDLFTKLFARRTKEACESCQALRQALAAKDDVIDNLRNEINYLRGERQELQTVFNRALRLEKIAKSEPTQPAQPQQVNASSWKKVQEDLERKHRKAPEDQVHAYWTKKSAELEHASGITPGPSPEVARESVDNSGKEN